MPSQVPHRPVRGSSSGQHPDLGYQFLGWSVVALWLYVATVALLDAEIFGVQLSLRYWLPIVVLGSVLLPRAVVRMWRHVGWSRERMAELGLGLASLLLAVLGADLLFGMYLNASTPLEDPTMAYSRGSDAHVWHGELYPRSYFPTERNFTVHKPGAVVSADVFGEFYSSQMLQSPLLVDSVLELRHVRYTIDNRGFRDTSGLADADVLALGDSFVFGYATDEGAVWVDQLEGLMGVSIYNLGVSVTGPAHQLMLLEDFLRSAEDSVRANHVLWMIFEGNDLENGYAQGRQLPPAGGRGLRSYTSGTLLGAVLDAPYFLMRSSIVGRFRGGDVTVQDPNGGLGEPLWNVDGVRLSLPLYHSAELGYSLFNPEDVRRATYDAAYVESHPNLPRLVETFDAMKDLSKEFGFRVTVLIAPSGPRLHGKAFAGFPALSSEPHFIRKVSELSSSHGFAVVDLLEAMTPFADEGLLYYRDDHHWNERGNEVAARVIAELVDFDTAPLPTS